VTEKATWLTLAVASAAGGDAAVHSSDVTAATLSLKKNSKLPIRKISKYYTFSERHSITNYDHFFHQYPSCLIK
jgi:hypothetical protein